MLAAGGAWVLKQLTHRPRAGQLIPSDATKWYGPFHGHKYDAFPSGHTMRIFAVATVLAGLYDDHNWVGITAFSLAGYTAFSRLVSGEHWPSDVFAGALLGYVVGRGVLHFQRAKAAKCFSYNLGSDGIGLAFRF
jgi:membrane-associated phospholipid phosphatase